MTPLSVAKGAARLDAALAGLDGAVAIAVSGGPDSVALFHLADSWARSRGRSLHVLTVDHGLRPDSATEAEAVATLARSRGRPHRTLRWIGAKPMSGLQAAARAARVRLLTAACRDVGVVALLLAHHRDDQVETVLHRIERDTGPEGLAGMAVRGFWDGVPVIRPLLDVDKARLVATCAAAGLAVFDDPANADPRFARSRHRAMSGALDTVGLGRDRVIRMATAMARARQAMAQAVRSWLADHATLHPCGTARLDRAEFSGLDPVFRAALLRSALRQAAGGGYPPATEATASLCAWITSPDAGRRTLAGCVIDCDPRGVVVMREPSACAPPATVGAGQSRSWDGRFLVTNATGRPVRVGACGETGWRRLRLTGAEPARPGPRDGLPHLARRAWPIVTDLDGVITVPHLVAGERGRPVRRGERVFIERLAPTE